MTMQILKFPLPRHAGHLSTVDVSKSSQLLSIQVQHGAIVAWYSVDVGEAEMRRDRFEIVGTGWEPPGRDWKYITTVQQGDFVWHIFGEDK